MHLYCYTCGFPSPTYTCPYCGGTDVEPYDTDGTEIAHARDWYGPGASDEDAANYDATHRSGRNGR
jgi:hypothetical protein